MKPPTPKLALTRARDMRREATPPEKRLWQSLRNRGLNGLKFRRQMPLGPFIIDFACEEARLVVEVDGASHAETNRDAARDIWLNAQGWRVVRIWNNDVMGNLDGVLLHILACAKDPHPGPLPGGEGAGPSSPSPPGRGPG